MKIVYMPSNTTMKAEIYDAHCHLDSLTEEQLNVILKKTKELGIKKLVTCSTSFASNEKNLLLAKKHPEILACIGLYPLDLIELTDEEILRAFNYFEEHQKDAIAIGEVGLDYKYCTNENNQKKQQKYLRKFIQFANSKNKPIVLHTRYAQRQVLNILEEEKATRVLLHSFSDSPKLMKKAVELGYFISVGLNITYREDIQKAILDFPLNNLLFETDAPISLNQKEVYSDAIIPVIEKVAELKKLPIEEVIAQQEKNFKKLFM